MLTLYMYHHSQMSRLARVGDHVHSMNSISTSMCKLEFFKGTVEKWTFCFILIYLCSCSQVSTSKH